MPAAQPLPPPGFTFPERFLCFDLPSNLENLFGKTEPPPTVLSSFGGVRPHPNKQVQAFKAEICPARDLHSLGQPCMSWELRCPYQPSLSFFLSLSLFSSLSLSFPLSFALSFPLSFALSFPLSFALYFPLSFALSFPLSFALSLFLSLFSFLFFPFSLSLSIFFHLLFQGQLAARRSPSKLLGRSSSIQITQSVLHSCDPPVNLGQAWLLFAVPFLARPLGSVFFGWSLGRGEKG